ncbi:MAG: hypothetical protein WAK92_04740 [Thiobacillus sp.]
MAPGMTKTTLFLIGAFALISSGTALAALTTEELTRLKTSGLGEDVIRFMVENGYDNVDRVVRLKEAGFADETISSVIRTDLKEGGEAALPKPQPAQAKQPQPVVERVSKTDAPVTMQTSAKVKIERYLVVGDPIVLNSQDIQKATISLLQGRRLKIEWDPSEPGSTLSNIHLNKPFETPFYWDLEKGDGLQSVNPKDNSFILRTGRSHQGSPTSNKSHRWVLHLTPDSPDLVKRIREILSE